MDARPRLRTEIIEAPLGFDTPHPEDGAGGAVCSFQGLTRPEHHHEFGPLLSLAYEAASPLADRILHRLAADIADRHHLRELSIVHAIGDVPVGEVSVVIVAVADHRDAAFTACREAIDRTKAEVPIWKRERWKAGSTWSSSMTRLAAGTPDAHSGPPA
jgi:molybdopterin synthase catalytic subunit